MQVIVDIHEAIQIIENVPADKLFLLTFDFDHEVVSNRGVYIDKGKSIKFIESAKTRILSGDKYTSQLNLYNVFQDDIYNIKPEGIMKTILLSGIG